MDDRVRRAADYIKDAIDGRETVSRTALGVRYFLLFSYFKIIQKIIKF